MCCGLVGAFTTAATLLAAGVTRQDKVAHYLYNCPEYLESMFGLYKAGLAPVNTNYRYAADELVYLWDNADVVAVVFHGAFVDQAVTGFAMLDAVIWRDWELLGDALLHAKPVEHTHRAGQQRLPNMKAWMRILVSQRHPAAK